MSFLLALIGALSVSWLVYHALTDISDLLSSEHGHFAKTLGALAAVSFAIRHYGQAAFADISKLLHWLSTLFFWGERFFEKCAKMLGNFFGSHEDLLPDNTRVTISPLKPISGPNNESLPTPIAVISTVVIALVVSAYYLGLFVYIFPDTVRPIEMKSDLVIKEKTRPKDIPNFADRFIVPNGCQGCGGQ